MADGHTAESFLENTIRCDACPVLCYIKRGQAGACDRYANVEGQLVRLDPHILLDRAKSQGTPLVPFLEREGEWDGTLAKSKDTFVTAIGAGTTYPDYKPAPPAEQRMPVQEPGTRPARALPYTLHVDARVDRAGRAVSLTFRNTGAAAAAFHVRSGDGKSGPWSYTVGPADELKDTFTASDPDYNFSVYGPNGFFRAFSGDIAGNAVQVEVDATYMVTKSGYDVASPGIILHLHNADAEPREITIHDGYTRKTETLTLATGATKGKAYPLDTSFGWYDLLVAVDGDLHFLRHVAGHVETGRDSVTDPAIGKASL